MRESLFKKYPVRMEQLVNRARSLGSAVTCGIRITPENKAQFQTFYHCPTCGHMGTRYSYHNNHYATCPSCSTMMTMELAGDDTCPWDSDGNYYIAVKLHTKES